jgi:hypothetical protein
MFCVELPLLEFVRLVSTGFSTKVSPLWETADLGPACWVMVSRRALAQVATCGDATKPGLAPNGTHFDCDSSDSLGLLGFLRF